MIIDRNVMEAILMFLYNTNEFEACEALFKVYQKSFYEEPMPKAELRLVREDGAENKHFDL